MAAAVALFCCPILLSAEEPHPFLTVEGGQLVRAGRPYRGVGANYFDLYLRVLHDPADASSLDGLARLSEAGIPFVRFACCGFHSREWQLYLENPEEHFRRLDLVVRRAEECKIGLIPSVFWTLVLHELVDEPKDQWGNPKSRTHALMRRYVRDLVTRYRHSPAIWAWEFGNEMNLQADLPNAAQFRRPGGTERDDLQSGHAVVALEEFAREIRRHDPQRAIFSGHSHPRPAAWHNTAERSWTADSREQTLEILARDNPAPLATIGIHAYAGPVQTDLAAWAADREDYFRAAKGLGRPVFVGEFGVGSESDPAAQRAAFEELIAAMEAAEIDLAAFWVYDLPSQATTWNVTFDNDRSFMIRLASEANRRWSDAARGSQP